MPSVNKMLTVLIRPTMHMNTARLTSSVLWARAFSDLRSSRDFLDEAQQMNSYARSSTSLQTAFLTYGMLSLAATRNVSFLSVKGVYANTYSL